MNKFNKLSNINQLVIMDSIYNLVSKGYNYKKIQNVLQKDLGFKIKVKTIKDLSEKESNFKEFENLLNKNNLIY